MTVYGALGLGLASLDCSLCGCDCVNNCTCTPDSVSFYMQAPNIDSIDFLCGSCPFDSPYLVTLTKELCPESFKYNIVAATHWLYRDEEVFCEGDCDGTFGGTPITHCYEETHPDWVCGNSGDGAAGCEIYTPSCSVACFSGSFTTPCYGCEYTGFDVPALTDFSHQLVFEFRALLGNPSVLFPGDTDCMTVPDETPCVLFIVMFVKRYMALNSSCTDLQLIDVTREEFYYILDDDCCGESECEAKRPPLGDTGRIAGCPNTVNGPALVAALANLGGIPCYPSALGIVADPGSPEQTKLTVDCVP